MKAKLDPTTTPEQKFARFQSALHRVLQVSKDDLNQRLAQDEKIGSLHKPEKASVFPEQNQDNLPRRRAMLQNHSGPNL
jgi:hypothetical protein